MKIVLDTNVFLVSISRYSQYHPIIEAFENQRYELLVTSDILLEYEEVVQWRMGSETTKNLLDGLNNFSNVTHIDKYFFWKLIAADPDDDKFVDCAIAGNADFIVSDDAHFKILKKISFPKVTVLSADEFLDLILQKSPG